MSVALSTRAGVENAWTRLRSRAAIGVAALAILAPIVIALVERRSSAAGAADRSLSAVFRIVIPLAAFSLSQLPIGGKNLRDAVWPSARFGLHRGFVAVGHVLVGAAASAAVATVAALVAVLVARAGRPALAHEVSLVADLATSAWIAVLVAAAYAAWFGLGATFGKVGGGRGIVLIADFIVGSVGFFGVLLPRGSAYNLIGLEAPLDIPQRAASGILIGVTVVCIALGALRCRR